MTIASTSFTSDWYVANGVKKNWGYDFTIYNEDSVILQVRDGFDNTTIVEFTADFQLVPQDADFSKGYVIYPSAGAALATGKQVRILRRVPITQETEIGSYGQFNPEIHERAFDKLTMIAQQQNDGFDRTIQVPFGYDALQPVLPLETGLLAWDNYQVRSLSVDDLAVYFGGATAEQGAKADTAVQPGETVANSNKLAGVEPTAKGLAILNAANDEAFYTAVGRDTRSVSKTGDTMSGALQLTDMIRVLGAIGQDQRLRFSKGNKDRWDLTANGAPETGGNEGSNFGLYRFDDAGNYIDPVFEASRKTGRVRFSLHPSIGDGSEILLSTIRTNNAYTKDLNLQRQGFFHIEGPQPTDGSLLHTGDPLAFAWSGIQSGDIARGFQIAVPYYNAPAGRNAMFWRRSGDGWGSAWRAFWDSDNLPISDFSKGALQAENAAAFRDYIGAGTGGGGGTAGVTTFKGRSGNVAPAAGDYLASQVSFDAGSVEDALRYVLRLQGSALSPDMFGAAGDGIADDTAAIQAMFNALPVGGIVKLTGRYKITSQVTLNTKSIYFQGYSRGNADRYTGFCFTGNGVLVIENSDFVKFDNVKFRCLAGKAAESYMVILQGSANVFMQSVTFACENVAGSRAMAVRGGSNRFRAIDFTATGAAGDHLLYFGGTLYNGADIIEMHQFALGAGDTTDLMLFEGQSGSAKFTNFAMNFGKRAVVVKRGSDGRASSFFYFAAGGFENGKQGPFRFEAGNNIQLVGLYIGSDSSGTPNSHGIYLGPQVSDVRISACVVRAHGGHGIMIDGAGSVNVQGCNITRNSTQNVNGYDGIRISPGSQDYNITGNNIGEQSTWDDDAGARVTAAALQRYGINNGAAVADGIIQANNLRGNTTAGLGGNTAGPGIANNLV